MLIMVLCGDYQILAFFGDSAFGAGINRSHDLKSGDLSAFQSGTGDCRITDVVSLM
jgi:hypothetical protein